MIHPWQKAFRDGPADLFERGGRRAPEIDEDEDTVRALHARIVGRARECHARERAGKRRGPRGAAQAPEPMPICQKSDTGKPAKGHKACPCLPGGLRMERPDHVRSADITCLPMPVNRLLRSASRQSKPVGRRRQ